MFSFLGIDSAVYHKSYQGGSGWYPSSTGYESLGGVVIRDITAASWGPNRTDVFVIGTNGATFHKYYTPATGFSNYENLGGVSISPVAPES